EFSQCLLDENKSFFSNINHGGAEHVNKVARTPFSPRSVMSLETTCLTFGLLSFEESGHGVSWIGVWRKRTFWKVDDAE
ncbi:hypothetical protein RYX36_005771, partial [Vicia faba]